MSGGSWPDIQVHHYEAVYFEVYLFSREDRLFEYFAVYLFSREDRLFEYFAVCLFSREDRLSEYRSKDATTFEYIQINRY